MSKTVAWFSAGGDSAVAIKSIIDRIDEIYYIHIVNQHEDTMRFVKDCQEWFGKKINILIPKDNESVKDVILRTGWVNGSGGARCTTELKYKTRRDWEKKQSDLDLTYVWGFDCNEIHRAEKTSKLNYEYEHIYPLIDMVYDKEMVHQIMSASRIKRPAMYDLGYNNNNCIMCVKGGMGYMNHMRVDFPDQFKEMAKLEREIGATCLKKIYLDELDPEIGRHTPPILEDCGILCNAIKI